MEAEGFLIAEIPMTEYGGDPLSHEAFSKVLVRYKGHEPHVSVPEGVHSIGEYAFANHKDLFSVQLPKGLREIGSWAFDRCEKLGSAELPEGLSVIGNNAFYACYNLSSIRLPDSLEVIGDSAFWGCMNLREVVLPEGLSEISHCVFKMCLRLNRVVIPPHVSAIGRWAFSDCESLTELVLPNGLERVSDHMLSGCKALKAIHLPEAVLSLGEWSFSGCSAIKALILPLGLTKIGEWAFKGCSGLRQLEIPAGVVSLGANAFHQCAGLERIEVSAENQFYTSAEGVLMSRDGKTLYRFPMAHQTTDYRLPWGAEEIVDRAFCDCHRLKTVVIPETVEEIGDFAFENCDSLTLVDFGHHLPSVREDTFRKCPELWLRMGPEAFNGFHLHEVIRANEEALERILLPFVSVWSRLKAHQIQALEDCLRSDETGVEVKIGPYLKLFEVVDTMEEKYELALTRMVHAIALTSAHYEVYRLYLRNNLKKCAWYYIKRHDAQGIHALIEHRVILPEDLDQIMEMANTGRHGEIMALLLQYKAGRTGFTEDKYTL